MLGDLGAGGNPDHAVPDSLRDPQLLHGRAPYPRDLVSTLPGPPLPGSQGAAGVLRRLQELCLRWLEPQRHSKEQVLELVVLEQLVVIPLRVGAGRGAVAWPRSPSCDRWRMRSSR